MIRSAQTRIYVRQRKSACTGNEDSLTTQIPSLITNVYVSEVRAVSSLNHLAHVTTPHELWHLIPSTSACARMMENKGEGGGGNSSLTYFLRKAL